jgi:methylated-DNA-[protein]-cysteine S-methyltransferase
MKPANNSKGFFTNVWMPSTPVGPLMLAASDHGLTQLNFCSGQDHQGGNSKDQINPAHRAGAILQDAMHQVGEYLAGKRRVFDLPLDLAGLSPFSRKILEETIRIPHGQVVTYGQLAVRAGCPRAPRAAGAALAHNPIALIIPCHRVVAASMHLNGFSAPGGLGTKAWLLRLEGLRVENERVLPVG